MDIKKILSEATNGALNEEVLSEIENVFEQKINDRVEIHVEKALNEQDELYTAESVKEAVKNTKAKKILEGLRSHLAVDSALEKESIKEAVIDGHNQINEASKKLESVAEENAVLKEELDTAKAKLVLEQKTAGLDKRTKQYVNKVMKGKDEEFINENFDYTLKLFKKKESDRLETLKEEALSTREDVDRVIYEDKQEVVNESVSSPYLDELSKY